MHSYSNTSISNYTMDAPSDELSKDMTPESLNFREIEREKERRQRLQNLESVSTPHAVHQNNFDPGRGNALQAATASIFGLPLEDVPNFIEMPNGYEAAIRDFCQAGGSNPIKITIANIFEHIAAHSDYRGEICILRGKSPRGDFGHVVVARQSGDGFEMIHDPHPEGTFLDSSEDFGWCMFFV